MPPGPARLACLENVGTPFLQPTPENPVPFSDIEIACQTPLRRNTDLARERPDITDDHLVPCGHHKAKLMLPSVDSLAGRPEGKLILVTVISPTPAGEGKTPTPWAWATR